MSSYHTTGACAKLRAFFNDASEGCVKWRDGVIHLYSFSKAYCVPGHRVGAIAAGPGFQAELRKALDTLQICPPRPASNPPWPAAIANDAIVR